MPSAQTMINFRYIALIVVVLVVTMIYTNVLRALGLESTIYLIVLALLLVLVALIPITSRFRNLYTKEEKVQVPESFKNRLNQGENIISGLTSKTEVNWYLTNKHLIRIQKYSMQRNVEDPVRLLPTQGLRFQYKTKTTKRKITLLFLSGLLTGIGVLTEIMAYLTSSSSTTMAVITALAFSVIGIVCVISALFLAAKTISYYQFMHPNLQEKNLERGLWRMRETSRNKETLKQFLSDIERYSNIPSITE